MDHGVDPENLGTGDWIYVLSTATEHLGGNVESVTDVPSLMSFYKSTGVNWVAIKAGTGAVDFPSAKNPQFTKEVVEAAHAEGIKIFGYSRSDGKDVPGEIKLAIKINDLGADGFIIDAESEWEPHILGADKDGPALAIELCQGIKKAYPNRFLGHAPLPVISLHSSFPYKEFGLYCDAVMPQDYWKSLRHTPKKMVERMDYEWRKWQDSLTGSDTNAIKPLVPLGHGWNLSQSQTVTELEILEFVTALNNDTNPVTPGGYKGVSYWRADLHTPEMWRGIKRARIGKPFTIPPELLAEAATAAETSTNASAETETETEKTPAVIQDPNDFVLDDTETNSFVTLVGGWYPGRNKQALYGDSYKCANAASEKATATATFRPKIEKEGPYDVFIWYNSMANRSTNSLWIISGEKKSITNHVNQTVSGGDWFQLASDVPFTTGTNGFVMVSNGTGEEPTHVVIADAVRFVWKGKKD